MINHGTKKQAVRLSEVANIIAFNTHFDSSKRDHGHLFSWMRGLERDLDDLRRLVVADLRADGASWSEVGELLGVTRQAAWERYG
jgi:hypothetical protein